MQPEYLLVIPLTFQHRRGLRCWTSGWQQAPESSLDPNNDNGPIPFTSSSLLALAYARIYLNLGPYRQLQTRDPQRIARALARCPEIDRSEGVIAALLYATHMLGIPVRLGVDRVAKSQAFFWSVRHSLASLDCAILLSKWLFNITRSAATHPLNGAFDSKSRYIRLLIDFQTARKGSCTGSSVLLKKHMQSLTLTTSRPSPLIIVILMTLLLPCSRSGHTSSRATLNGRSSTLLGKAWQCIVACYRPKSRGSPQNSSLLLAQSCSGLSQSVFRRALPRTGDMRSGVAGQCNMSSGQTICMS